MLPLRCMLLMHEPIACGWEITTSFRHCIRSTVQNLTLPSFPPEMTMSRVACTACVTACALRMLVASWYPLNRYRLPSCVPTTVVSGPGKHEHNMVCIFPFLFSTAFRLSKGLVLQNARCLMPHVTT